MKDLNFGIFVSGVNLNDPNLAYFDVVAEVFHDFNETLSHDTIPLTSCHESNWNQT